jgi:hypothetical protein
MAALVRCTKVSASVALDAEYRLDEKRAKPER